MSQPVGNPGPVFSRCGSHNVGHNHQLSKLKRDDFLNIKLLVWCSSKVSRSICKCWINSITVMRTFLLWKRYLYGGKPNGISFVAARVICIHVLPLHANSCCRCRPSTSTAVKYIILVVLLCTQSRNMIALFHLMVYKCLGRQHIYCHFIYPRVLLIILGLYKIPYHVQNLLLIRFFVFCC